MQTVSLLHEGYVNGNHVAMSTVVMQECNPHLALLLTYRNFLDHLVKASRGRIIILPDGSGNVNKLHIIANYVVLCLHRSIMHLDSLISKKPCLVAGPKECLIASCFASQHLRQEPSVLDFVVSSLQILVSWRNPFCGIRFALKPSIITASSQF